MRTELPPAPSQRHAPPARTVALRRPRSSTSTRQNDDGGMQPGRPGGSAGGGALARGTAPPGCATPRARGTLSSGTGTATRGLAMDARAPTRTADAALGDALALARAGDRRGSGRMAPCAATAATTLDDAPTRGLSEGRTSRGPAAWLGKRASVSPSASLASLLQDGLSRRAPTATTDPSGRAPGT